MLFLRERPPSLARLEQLFHHSTFCGFENHILLVLASEPPLLLFTLLTSRRATQFAATHSVTQPRRSRGTEQKQHRVAKKLQQTTKTVKIAKPQELQPQPDKQSSFKTMRRLLSHECHQSLMALQGQMLAFSRSSFAYVIRRSINSHRQQHFFMA